MKNYWNLLQFPSTNLKSKLSEHITLKEFSFTSSSFPKKNWGQLWNGAKKTDGHNSTRAPQVDALRKMKRHLNLSTKTYLFFVPTERENDLRSKNRSSKLFQHIKYRVQFSNHAQLISWSHLRGKMKVDMDRILKIVP